MAMHQQMVPRAQMSQQLRMTPQLQQAIKLLQLSRMELITLVRQEMVENPVLEEVQESYEAEALYEKEMGVEQPQVKEKVDETKEVKADSSDMNDDSDNDSMNDQTREEQAENRKGVG